MMIENKLAFISYSSKDKSFAQNLARELRGRGIKIWMDEVEILPGESIIGSLEKAIEKSEYLLVVLSKASVQSEWVKSEWRMALHKEITYNKTIVVPILKSDCKIPGFLQDKLLVDLRPTSNHDAELEKLYRRLISSPQLLSGADCLVEAEERYRQQIRNRFVDDAAYYIDLAGNITELPAPPARISAPRSDKRRRMRAEVEYYEWIQDEKVQAEQNKRLKGLDLPEQQVNLSSLKSAESALPVQHGEQRRFKRLQDVLYDYPSVVLLADPGGGKTTALRRLALTLADDPERLPILLPLSEFKPNETVKKFIHHGLTGKLNPYRWDATDLANKIESYLDKGKLVFLFDAYDKMPRKEYESRAQDLIDFINLWAGRGNRFVVACRVLDYGEELTGFIKIHTQLFNQNQILAFLKKELPQDWERMWQRLVEGNTEQRRLIEMARNPYLLTMMIDVFAEDGDLTRDRSKLMRRFTGIMLEWARSNVAPNDFVQKDSLHDALAKLAFEIHRHEGIGSTVEINYVKSNMPTKFHKLMDKVLNLAVGARIIELSIDRSSVWFCHQLLQEYFAAFEILKRDQDELIKIWRWKWLESEIPHWKRPAGDYGPLPPPPPNDWDEAIILATDLIQDKDDSLINALIEKNPVLAGRCLIDRQVDVCLTTKERLVCSLVETISDPKVALRVRIAAGKVLGHLGDPRLGKLVTIPAGPFLMGYNGDHDANPQHEVFLPEYRIGKYPVTNVEFDRFIKEGGYKERCWWTRTGWKQKNRFDWTEPRFRHNYSRDEPNYPVIGVSWYECEAYCNWLSAVTQEPHRLPSEAEWEKAARGISGSQYPWGNEFESNRLNSQEGNQVVMNITPVGIYPTGVSQSWCFDMAGNI